MKTEWLVARYVRDLRRGEQRNIGVVLFHNGHAYMRFMAEDPAKPKGVDGHKMRGVVSSTDNYKDWVESWRYEVAERGTPIEELVARRAGDNYFLQRGGYALVDDERDPDALLDRLYTELVAPLPEAESDELSVAESVFEEVGQACHLEQQYELNLDPDRLLFEYAIPRSKPLLFRTCKLNSSPKKTWAAVHDAVYSVETANSSGLAESYVVAYESDPGDQVSRQRATLCSRLPERVIVVEDRSAAVRDLLALIEGSRAPIVTG